MSESTRIERERCSERWEGNAAPELQPSNPASNSEVEHAAISAVIRAAAEQYRGNGLRLLRLLRLLEALHREIREDLFQEALPDNRQALHALLRDMEAEGGWPYINRMRLQSLLAQFATEQGVEAVGDVRQAKSDDRAIEPSDAIESVE